MTLTPEHSVLVYDQGDPDITPIFLNSLISAFTRFPGAAWSWHTLADAEDLLRYDRKEVPIPRTKPLMRTDGRMLVPLLVPSVACLHYGWLYILMANAAPALVVRVKVTARYAAFLGDAPTLLPCAEQLTYCRIRLSSSEALIAAYTDGLDHLKKLYDTVAANPGAAQDDPRLVLFGVAMRNKELIRLSDNKPVAEVGMPPFQEWRNLTQMPIIEAFRLLARHSRNDLVAISEIPAGVPLGELSASGTMHAFFSGETLLSAWETFRVPSAIAIYTHTISRRPREAIRISLNASAPLGSGHRRLWYVHPVVSQRKFEEYFEHQFVYADPCADGEAPEVAISPSLVELLFGALLRNSASVRLLLLAFDQYESSASVVSLEAAVRAAFNTFSDFIRPYQKNERFGSVLLSPAIAAQSLSLPQVAQPQRAPQKLASILNCRRLACIAYIDLKVQFTPPAPVTPRRALSKEEHEQLRDRVLRALRSPSTADKSLLSFLEVLETDAECRNFVQNLYAKFPEELLREAASKMPGSRDAIIGRLIRERAIRILGSKDIVIGSKDDAGFMPVLADTLEGVDVLEDASWFTIASRKQWTQLSVFNYATPTTLAHMQGAAALFTRLTAEEDESRTFIAWLRAHSTRSLDRPLREVLASVSVHTDAERRQFAALTLSVDANESSWHRRYKTSMLDVELFPEIVAARKFRTAQVIQRNEAPLAFTCQPVPTNPIISPYTTTFNPCTGATVPPPTIRDAPDNSFVALKLAISREEARHVLEASLDEWSEEVLAARLAGHLYHPFGKEPRPIYGADIAKALAALGEIHLTPAYLEYITATDAVAAFIASYPHPSRFKAVGNLAIFWRERTALRRLATEGRALQRDPNWAAILSAEQRAAMANFIADADSAVRHTNASLLEFLAYYRTYFIQRLMDGTKPPIGANEKIKALEVPRNARPLLSAELTALTTDIYAHVKAQLAPIKGALRGAHAVRFKNLRRAAYQHADEHAVPRAALLRHLGVELPVTGLRSLVERTVGTAIRARSRALRHDALIGTVIEHTEGGDMSLYLKALGATPPEPPLSIADAHAVVVAEGGDLLTWAVFAWSVLHDTRASLGALSSHPSPQQVVAASKQDGTPLERFSKQGTLLRLLEDAIRAFWPKDTQARLVRMYYRLVSAYYAGASALWGFAEGKARQWLGMIIARDTQGQPPAFADLAKRLSSVQQVRARGALENFSSRFTPPPLPTLTTDAEGALRRCADALSTNKYDISGALFALDSAFTDIYNEWMRLQVAPYAASMRMLLTDPAWLSVVAEDDPLARGNSLQHSFFRPRTASMLPAALNTFFCAEPDPERDVTSLSRQVWAERISLLGKDDPRTARILGRWTSNDVAHAAIAMALRRIEAEGPAYASIERDALFDVLWQLLRMPDFVRWRQKYALDNRQHTTSPFASVVLRPGVRVDEPLARSLANALLEQNPGALKLFGQTTQRYYDTPATNAHEIWRLAVFGPTSDPGAYMEEYVVGQSGITTLDLVHQTDALIELDALLRTIKTNLPWVALLPAVMYFVLTQLAPQDNLFTQVLQPDGSVLFDYFHSDVVPHIERTVYGCPVWPKADLRSIGEMARAYVRSIDRKWTQRAADVLFNGDVNTLWTAIWHAHISVSPRVLVRYPRDARPGADLKLGQSMVFLHRGQEWFDVSPLAGVNTRLGSTDGTFSADTAAFVPEPEYSYYEWRVGATYSYDPDIGRRNDVDGAEGGQALALYARHAVPELLTPQNLPYAFVVEWLVRNTVTDSTLIRMAQDAVDVLANKAPHGPTVLTPVRGTPQADAHSRELAREKVNQLEKRLAELRRDWDSQNALLRRALGLSVAAGPAPGLGSLISAVDSLLVRFDPQVRNARKDSLNAKLTDTETQLARLAPADPRTTDLQQRTVKLRSDLEALNLPPQPFREAEFAAIERRFEDARRGIDAYREYAQRLRNVAVPLLDDELKLLAELEYPNNPAELPQWLHVPTLGQ